MKSYRRILVPILHKAHGESLLHTLKEITSNHQPQVLVVRLLDTNLVFAPDGPAANLPDEIASRRIPEAMKQLELQLARENLAWVEARVIKGNPFALIRELIGSWRPDLLLTNPALLPTGIPSEVDVLSISGRSILRRLLDGVTLPLPRHA